MIVVVLAAAETISVIAGSTAPEPAAAVVTALSVLVLLGFRWQPLAACIAAFLGMTVGLAVTPQSRLGRSSRTARNMCTRADRLLEVVANRSPAGERAASAGA